MSVKDLEFKWERVKAYYEKAYATEFKKRPDPEKIELLYNKMLQLKWDAASHFEKRPNLRLAVDNTCQHPETVVNDLHDGNQAS